MRIALGQYNPTVGDLKGNTARMAELIDRAAEAGAELVVFGELSVTGYPPRDLLSKEGFVAESERIVREELAGHCRDIAALVGFVRPNPDPRGRRLQNAAALLAGGEVREVHVKSLLPSYDVFDETRYFEPGPPVGPIEFGGVRLGLSICEDLWDAAGLGRELYDRDPVRQHADAGADVLVNLAASPFEVGKARRREELFARQAQRVNRPILYANQVGGNDELLFDGASCAVDSDGRVMVRAGSFVEDLPLVDLGERARPQPGRIEPQPDDLQALSAALKMGIADYVRKCGFRSVVLGLSGGIDSAVVAALAADALGPEQVTALAMPSRYSSEHSVDDARALARALGCEYVELPIESMHSAYEKSLGRHLAGGAVDLAAENVQARIRGNLVMAISNAHGHLALATGNKSELAVGYCTLYGDMCGGLAPIGDVMKTDVYRLAEQLNRERSGKRIPTSTLTKPPSAELKPGQTDQDKLPPYETLDGILRLYVEEDATAGAIIETGYDADLVHRVVRMVDLSEYKRQQAARVLKVSHRAFGMGRRVPIAQRFVH